LVAIDVHKSLRHAREECRRDQADLRPLLGRRQELAQVVRQELHVASGPVFEYELESPGCPHAGDRRRRKTEGNSRRKLAQVCVQTRLDFLKLLFPGGALVPRLQGDKEKAVIARTHEAQKAKADHARCVLNAWHVGKDLFNLPCSLRGALKRGRVWKLHFDVQVTLVFVRQETGRHSASEENTRPHRGSQQNHRQHTLAKKRARPMHVSVCRALEYAIESVKESLEQPTTLGLRPQQKRSERGTQGKRVEGREKHRDRDCHGELL